MRGLRLLAKSGVAGESFDGREFCPALPEDMSVPVEVVAFWMWLNSDHAAIMGDNRFDDAVRADGRNLKNRSCRLGDDHLMMIIFESRLEAS